MAKLNQEVLEFLASLDVSETAIEIFKQFTIDAEAYHPNSNMYRSLERDAMLRIGYELGKNEK